MPSQRASATSPGMRPVTWHRSVTNRAPCRRSASIDLERGPDGGGLRRPAASRRGEEPVEVVAPVEADRGRGRRRRPAAPRPGARPVRAANREPAEGDLAPRAPLVEHGRVVTRHAGGEDRRLPGVDGRLVALQLLDHLEHAAGPEQSVTGPDVLPCEKETHELLGTDRLDRPARTRPHRRVDPGEQVPGAESFARLGPRGGRLRDATAQHRAFPHEPGKGRADLPAASRPDRGRQRPRA